MDKDWSATVRQRLVHKALGHVEELLEGVDADDPRLAEEGLDGRLWSGCGRRVGAGGASTGR